MIDPRDIAVECETMKFKLRDAAMADAHSGNPLVVKVTLLAAVSTLCDFVKELALQRIAEDFVLADVIPDARGPLPPCCQPFMYAPGSPTVGCTLPAGHDPKRHGATLTEWIG